MTLAAERLARLAASGKHISGEGFGTGQPDLMLLAGSLCGLSSIGEELIRGRYLLDERAQKKLVLMISAKASSDYDLEPSAAFGVGRAAVYCVMADAICKTCNGAGVNREQVACKRCDGVGRKPISDRRRALVAGIDKSTWLRSYADITDNLETHLQHELARALELVARLQKEGEFAA